MLILLFGALLAFVFYSWDDSDSVLSLISIGARHADVPKLQDRPDHLSNLTLKRRQTFQYSPNNTYDSRTYYNESGHCGNGESSAKASMNSHMELILDRFNVLREWLRF